MKMQTNTTSPAVIPMHEHICWYTHPPVKTPAETYPPVNTPTSEHTHLWTHPLAEMPNSESNSECFHQNKAHCFGCSSSLSASFHHRWNGSRRPTFDSFIMAAIWSLNINYVCLLIPFGHQFWMCMQCLLNVPAPVCVYDAMPVSCICWFGLVIEIQVSAWGYCMLNEHSFIQK